MAQPTKYGTDADDEIWADNGWQVFGLKGNDIIHYGTYIDAGDGNDVIHDGTDDSTILGGNGNDSIYDSYGSDTINAGSGDDYFAFSGLHTHTTDHNEVDLGSGNDTAYVALADIAGTTSTLVGGAGLDTLVLSGENMNLGPRTLDLRGLSSGAAIKIEGYTISGFERVVVRDTFTIQNVQFGELNDYFFGEGDHNTVYGNGGDDFLQSGPGIGDRLYGGAGDDIIAALGANYTDPHYAFGGDGNDMIVSAYGFADYSANSQLSGGAGVNGFVKMLFQDSESADTIVDFKAGQDWLGFGLQRSAGYDLDVTRRIEMPKYNIVNNADTLSFDTPYIAFRFGPQGDAHFSYDKKTGILSVEKTEPDDANHGVQFYLKGAPNLTPSDFFSMTIQRGDDGNDTVYGNNYSNFLKGDTDYYGKGGNDIIYGEGGEDQIQAGMGNDFINGGSGADLMFGEKGNDIYIVSEVGDITYENANEGMDTVRSAISWTLATNVERLELLGSANLTGNGNELANAIIGNSGRNILSGGAGDDTLDGRGNADVMSGGSGNDSYYFDNVADVVNESAAGSIGIDKVYSSMGLSLANTQQVKGNVENLTLLGTASINGTGNNLDNVIVGNSGANTLSGNGGSDTLDGGQGADTLSGGIGSDRYFIDNVGDKAIEANVAGVDKVHSSVSYSISGQFIENLTLTGTANINGTGNSLANAVAGNSGSNIINGGLGNDTLFGGASADRFVFNTALGNSNVDKITDFNVPLDAIWLDNAVFTALGANGLLSAEQFHVGTGAHDANDRIIYNSASGALFYDNNGSAVGGSVQFATLNKGLAMTNADFLII